MSGRDTSNATQVSVAARRMLGIALDGEGNYRVMQAVAEFEKTIRDDERETGSPSPEEMPAYLDTLTAAVGTDKIAIRNALEAAYLIGKIGAAETAHKASAANFTNDSEHFEGCAVPLGWARAVVTAFDDGSFLIDLPGGGEGPARSATTGAAPGDQPSEPVASSAPAGAPNAGTFKVGDWITYYGEGPVQVLEVKEGWLRVPDQVDCTNHWINIASGVATHVTDAERGRAFIGEPGPRQAVHESDADNRTEAALEREPRTSEGPTAHEVQVAYLTAEVKRWERTAGEYKAQLVGRASGEASPRRGGLREGEMVCIERAAHTSDPDSPFATLTEKGIEQLRARTPDSDLAVLSLIAEVRYLRKLATERRSEAAPSLVDAERILRDLVATGDMFAFTSDQFLARWKNARRFLHEKLVPAEAHSEDDGDGWSKDDIKSGKVRYVPHPKYGPRRESAPPGKKST